MKGVIINYGPDSLRSPLRQNNVMQILQIVKTDNLFALCELFIRLPVLINPMCLTFWEIIIEIIVEKSKKYF